jgi:hypothetical protein
MGLKDLFWVPNEDGQKPGKVPPSPLVGIKVARPNTDNLAVSVGLTSNATASSGKIDDNLVTVLTKALEAAAKNKPPYNYLQFSKAVNEQLVMIPDEPTRYRAAIATAGPMGVTPQTLIDDTAYYIEALKEESGKFEATMASVIKNNITVKEAQVKDIDALTQKNAAEIKKLTDEISEFQVQKGELTNKIMQQKIEIQQTKNNFEATLTIFLGKISTDLEKIKKYLLTSSIGGLNV